MPQPSQDQTPGDLMAAVQLVKQVLELLEWTNCLQKHEKLLLQEIGDKTITS